MHCKYSIKKWNKKSLFHQLKLHDGITEWEISSSFMWKTLKCFLLKLVIFSSDLQQNVVWVCQCKMLKVKIKECTGMYFTWNFSCIFLDFSHILCLYGKQDDSSWNLSWTQIYHEPLKSSWKYSTHMKRNLIKKWNHRFNFN